MNKKKRRKNDKYDYINLSSIEVYNLVETGKISRFPDGYIIPENMKEIIREVVLNRIKLTRKEICKNLNYVYLRRYFLGGSRRAFSNSIFNLVSYCFPEMDIKQWELNKVEPNFWENKENRRDFMSWLADKENINVENIDDLKKIDAKLITKYGGSKALKYGGGTFELISLIAKCEVKEWQVIKMPVWTEEKVKVAVKWMIEEKLRWSHEDVVKKINAKVFYKYDLGGMLCKYCLHSPIKALQIAYPGEYDKVRYSKSS